MSSSGDYGSTARSLAVNEPSPPTTPTLERGRPSWNRRRSTASMLSSARPQSSTQEAMKQAEAMFWWALGIWKSLPWWQRIAASVLILAFNVLIILFFVYNESILEWLHPKAVAWSEKPAGWILIWALIFICGFPPVIGYSSMLTISGFIYGVGKGWLIAASANVAGSLAAFLVCRRFFSGWVERKFATQTQFQALSLVLKHDGLKLLTMIRLCPLPYSASNGALSTFKTLTPQAFATASALATPKLFIHVFVGSRFGAIGKDGRKMDATSKAVNYISIVGGLILGAVTGVMIYRRTKARAQQLELEEQAKLEEREAALADPDIFEDDDDGDYDGDYDGGDLNRNRSHGRDRNWNHGRDARDIDERAVAGVVAQLGDDIDFLDPPTPIGGGGDGEPYRDESRERIGLQTQGQTQKQQRVKR